MAINQKLREFQTRNSKLQLKKSYLEPEIFEIFQLTVVAELHFTQFCDTVRVHLNLGHSV